MAYLGNPPATQFASLTYQDLTGGSGTAFTLDSPVGSAQDIEVFVNNVRQEPGVAYTVAGTALTMTGSIASTDDFYVVFQGKSIGTANHPSGSALEATTGTFSGEVSISGGIGNLIRVQTFTADGTYTKSSGATKALVYVVGGGGGGGGVDGQGSTTGGAGGGGAGGGVAIKLITSGLGATETVTVGSGGAGGAAGANTGSTGGTSSFGSHCSATGGAGGAGRTAAAFSQATMSIGGKGGIGSNGDVNIRGGSGQFGISAGTSAAENSSGEGGDSLFGGGAQSIQGDNAGRDAEGLGGGGSGGSINGSTDNKAGGAGEAGIVVVYEYL